MPLLYMKFSSFMYCEYMNVFMIYVLSLHVQDIISVNMIARIKLLVREKSLFWGMSPLAWIAYLTR